MYRTCLLAAALLLAGCSEPNHVPVPVPVARDPLAVGTEVFLTQRVVKHLNDIVDATHTIFPHVERHPDFVVGTKVRIFEVGPQSAPRPWVRGVMLDGPYEGHNLLLFRDELLIFAP